MDHMVLSSNKNPKQSDSAPLRVAACLVVTVRISTEFLVNQNKPGDRLRQPRRVDRGHHQLQQYQQFVVEQIVL